MVCPWLVWSFLWRFCGSCGRFSGYCGRFCCVCGSRGRFHGYCGRFRSYCGRFCGVSVVLVVVSVLTVAFRGYRGGSIALVVVSVVTETFSAFLIDLPDWPEPELLCALLGRRLPLSGCFWAAAGCCLLKRVCPSMVGLAAVCGLDICSGNKGAGPPVRPPLHRPSGSSVPHGLIVVPLRLPWPCTKCSGLASCVELAQPSVSHRDDVGLIGSSAGFQALSQTCWPVQRFAHV